MNMSQPKQETKEKSSSLEPSVTKNENDSSRSKQIGNFNSQKPESQGSANPFINDKEKMQRIHEV